MTLQEEVRTAHAPAPVGPYSQAIQANGFVFASGQIPLDPETGKPIEGDIEAQTERVIANLRAVLEAGGASLDTVVRATVYLPDLTLFPRMNAIYAKHFVSKPAPARVTIGISALPFGVAVEIDAIALIKKKPARKARPTPKKPTSKKPTKPRRKARAR